MAKKQSLKLGERILFSIVGVFFLLSALGFIVMETVRLKSDKPMFVVKTHYDFSETGKKGSEVFREAGCTACHKALRNGTNSGLELDGIGSIRSVDWIYRFLKHPEQAYNEEHQAETVDHGLNKEADNVSAMPDEQLQAIAVFLSELKADQGSAVAKEPPPEDSAFIDTMVKTWAPEEWKEKHEDIRVRLKREAKEMGESD